MSYQAKTDNRALLGRSGLVLLHYTVIVVFPLIITLILFFYFDSNSAEFQQQSLSVKFTGPIAAYAGLVLIFRLILDGIFETLRKEDEHRKKILLNDIPIEEAIARCESFAELLARFVVIDVVRAAMRGYTDDQVNQITSTVRKRLYGLTNANVFIGLTVHDGKFELSSLITAALNNSEWIEELKSTLASSLSNIPASEKKEFREPYNLPGVQVISMHDNSALPIDTPLQSQLLSQVLSKFDLDLSIEKLKNVIWRQCENAIKYPETAEKMALGKP